MLVRLGENDVKTLEDFAGCVTDDLTGWFETVERKRVRQDGILDGFDISPEEAEALIMSARVKAGWVTQEELDALAAEKAAAEAAAQAEELAAAEGLEGGEVLAGLETSSDSASDTPTEASTPDTDAAL
jgi:N utilization substance protein A